MNGRDGVETRRRVRVERGVYRQPNGKYAVCFVLDDKPRFAPSRGDGRALGAEAPGAQSRPRGSGHGFAPGWRGDRRGGASPPVIRSRSRRRMCCSASGR